MRGGALNNLLDSRVVNLAQSDGHAVESRKLTKLFGSTVAVDGLNLSVPRGGVYGFLGPNGAGKTTVLKMLLGLTRPTSGSVRVLGAEPGTSDGLSRVGALIESPGFYPYLSGLSNLTVTARYAGVPASRATEVLRQVGLASKAKEAYGRYSLGMKQRLGVAAALLKNPELLVLDEPTNGLDVRGMMEMRALVRRLGQENRTVLLSSHQMWEVEQLCDRVGVIHKGRLVAEGSVEDLKRQAGLEVRAEPVGRAREVARKVRGVGDVRPSGDGLWLSAGPELAHKVVGALVDAGVKVSEVRPAGMSLEELFLRLTEEDKRWK